MELSEDNDLKLWIAPDFAHGFLSGCESINFLGKTADYNKFERQLTIAWSDESIIIDCSNLELIPLLFTEYR